MTTGLGDDVRLDKKLVHRTSTQEQKASFRFPFPHFQRNGSILWQEARKASREGGEEEDKMISHWPQIKTGVEARANATLTLSKKSQMIFIIIPIIINFF